MPHAARILVVEDDPLVRKAVRLSCESAGYAVQEVGTGRAALEIIETAPPDLIVLDVRLPDMLGFDVCREIRQRGVQTPVLFLSAQTEEIDVVIGLEIGANDYISKPFRPRELLARIAVHLRSEAPPSPLAPAPELDFVFRDFIILPEERRVLRKDEEVILTHTEFDLLLFFAHNAGRVLSQPAIFSGVWGSDRSESRVLPVHIGNLRHKIEPDPTHPRYILTVPGVGYRFVALRATED